MIDTTKTKFRSFYKKLRNEIPTQERKNKSELIAQKFLSEFLDDSYKTYFIYNSFSSEVETGDIMQTLWKFSKKILIPKCNTDELTMKAVVYNPQEKLTENIYGIAENESAVDFSGKIDIIVLPGIAFDSSGTRIGFGKGYYDRFINSLTNTPILVGLCFEEQLCNDNLPYDEHDKKVDYIITDQQFVKITKNRDY